MKRKPDMLWVLVALFSIGVLTTGYSQDHWIEPETASISQQAQQ